MNGLPGPVWLFVFAIVAVAVVWHFIDALWAIVRLVGIGIGFLWSKVRHSFRKDKDS